MDLSKIPEHMRESVILYVDHGIPPGGFLRAVLENNLTEAAAQADEINKHHLYDWACVMYNEIPQIARGSREMVDRWLKFYEDIRNTRGGS